MALERFVEAAGAEVFGQRNLPRGGLRIQLRLMGVTRGVTGTTTDNLASNVALACLDILGRIGNDGNDSRWPAASEAMDKIRAILDKEGALA